MKGIGRVHFLWFVFFMLLAIVFFGYIIFPNRTGKAPQYISFIPHENLLNVAQATITREGDPFVVNLERDQQEWKLVIDNSHKVPVRKSRIDGFLKTFSEKHKILSIGKAEKKKFGLEIPGSYTVQLRDKTGKIITDIEFGNNDESGICRYFMIHNQQEILRMDTTIDEYLDIRASAWAELAIFAQREARYNIQKITVFSDKQTRVFLAGKDKEVLQFETELAHLECLDVTNIATQKAETITIVYGNMNTTVIDLASLGENWILTDSNTGGSYIITDIMKTDLDRTLGMTAVSYSR